MNEKHELDDTLHEQMLAEGQRRFPLESYRRLLESGSPPDLALKMLGWKMEEVPAEARAQL